MNILTLPNSSITVKVTGKVVNRSYIVNIFVTYIHHKLKIVDTHTSAVKILMFFTSVCFREIYFKECVCFIETFL